MLRFVLLVLGSSLLAQRASAQATTTTCSSSSPSSVTCTTSGTASPTSTGSSSTHCASFTSRSMDCTTTTQRPFVAPPPPVSGAQSLLDGFKKTFALRPKSAVAAGSAPTSTPVALTRQQRALITLRTRYEALVRDSLYGDSLVTAATARGDTTAAIRLISDQRVIGSQLFAMRDSASSLGGSLSTIASHPNSPNDVLYGNAGDSAMISRSPIGYRAIAGSPQPLFALGFFTAEGVRWIGYMLDCSSRRVAIFKDNSTISDSDLIAATWYSTNVSALAQGLDTRYCVER